MIPTTEKTLLEMLRAAQADVVKLSVYLAESRARAEQLTVAVNKAQVNESGSLRFHLREALVALTREDPREEKLPPISHSIRFCLRALDTPPQEGPTTMEETSPAEDQLDMLCEIANSRNQDRVANGVRTTDDPAHDHIRALFDIFADERRRTINKQARAKQLPNKHDRDPHWDAADKDRE